MTNSRRPRIEEVIARAVDAGVREVFTTIPARIHKWDSNKKRAECKILVKNSYLDEEEERQTESWAIVTGVPIQFPGVGPFRITMPISDGSLVLNGSKVPPTTGSLVFSHRSLDKWLSGDGREVDPEYDHHHGHNDAIFVPGLRAFGDIWDHWPDDKMSIGRDQNPSDIEIDGSGNIVLAGGTKGAARVDDPCKISSPGALATWMSQVEAVCNGVSAGAVAPLSATILATPGIVIKTGSDKVDIG